MSKIEIPVISSLQTTIEKMMKDLHVPGAAVAVIKDGEVIVSEGFGYRDSKQKNRLRLKHALQLDLRPRHLAPYL